MPDSFTRPSDITSQQDNFSTTEVGITHPINPSFIKLLDNGDIELIGGDGVGIILSAANNSITLVADTIRFLTHGTNALVWNNLAFNDQANTYSQPTFLVLDNSNMTQLYEGVDAYLGGTNAN